MNLRYSWYDSMAAFVSCPMWGIFLYLIAHIFTFFLQCFWKYLKKCWAIGNLSFVSYFYSSIHAIQLSPTIKCQINASLTLWLGSLPFTPLEIIKGGNHNLLPNFHSFAPCFFGYILFPYLVQTSILPPLILTTLFLTFLVIYILFPYLHRAILPSSF
jgi:hypothetical protein